ncbi:MAG: DNA polymerase III subunit delta [Patescibacteria group bacterium]|jgi:DNA polymerase-3 subunit delta
MILLLTGPDSYRVFERKRQLIEAFRKKYDEHGNNIAVLSGSEATIDEVIGQTRTAGLFTSNRMIVLDRASKAKAAVLKQLTEFFAHVTLPEEVVLLLVEPELTTEKTKDRIPVGITKYLAALTKNKSVKHEPFPPFTPRERKIWAKRRLDDADASCEEAAMIRLLAACGDDTWMLAHELDKLAARAAGAPITEEMVGEMTVGQLDVNIFALTDALGEGRGKRALAILEDHFANGETPAYLFAMLGRHVRLLLGAKAMERPTADVLVRDLGVHPFVARKVLEQSSRFSLAALITLHHNLLGAEYTMKTSRVDPRILLERLLIPLAI